MKTLKLFGISIVSISALALLGQAAKNTPPAPVPAPTAAPVAPAAAPTEAPLDPTTPDDLKQYGIDRYQKIVEKSPFAFKIVRQEGPPAVSFATDLVLAGYTIDAGKGVTYASLVDKKKNNRFVINTAKPNNDGIQLVAFNRGSTLLETTIRARKGSEEVEIKSDKDVINRKAVVNAGVAPRAGQPAQPGQPGMNRGNPVQSQINNQLQPPIPPGGGNNPNPNAPQGTPQPQVAPQAQPAAGPPPTAGDIAAGVAQPAPAAQAPPQAGGRRRVILPPPVVQ